jgi:hypothetical protein
MRVKQMMAWFRAYTAHDDPRVAASNLIALMVASNGPFYPLYVWLLLGRPFWPSLLTMLSSPLFFAVPAVARRHSVAGRAMLPLVGILNTLICIKALGEASQVGLFLLPCIAIPAMTMRPRQRLLQLALVGLPIAIFLFARGHFGAPLYPYSEAQFAEMTALNTGSVMTFTGFLGLVFAGVLTEAETKQAADSPMRPPP